MTYLWELLQNTTLPVVIYGMGDGADKLLACCNAFSVPVADIFASDEYVRGHEFHGYRVLRYDEVCQKYDNFIILLAFAAFEEGLMEKITGYAKKHQMYAPDLPLFGGDILTPKWICDHADDINKAYNLLADDISRNTFESVLRYKLGGDILTLRSCETIRDDVFTDIIHLSDNETYLDLGAYNGDTIHEFCTLVGGKYKEIIAVEPDRKNYQKLMQSVSQLKNVQSVNVGVWNEVGTISFSGGGGRASCLVPDMSVETQTSKRYNVSVDTIDNIVGDRDVTYIKMDVEGAEHEALLGGQNTLLRCMPRLAVSAYHRTDDFVTLILRIHEINPRYRIYLRHHPYIPAWETNLYCV